VHHQTGGPRNKFFDEELQITLRISSEKEHRWEVTMNGEEEEKQQQGQEKMIPHQSMHSSNHFFSVAYFDTPPSHGWNVNHDSDIKKCKYTVTFP